MKKIIIITDYRGFFRQKITQAESLDVTLMKDILIRNGFDTTIFTYEEIINNSIKIHDSIIIYTSSQFDKYKNYIDDIIYYLSKDNYPIPNYEILKCHENKGYQELYKLEKNIKSLNYNYFSNLSGLIKFKEDLVTFPLIFKKTSGANSSYVYKISDEQQLISMVKRVNQPAKKQNQFIVYFKKIYRKYIKKNPVIEDKLEDKYWGQYILQEYIDNLEGDWKVLVFGEKYYFLSRKTKNNDFRASGSGKFSFTEEPPIEVMDYARYIFNKIDAPYVSLDIAFDGNSCYLIEFQGIHIGPVTLIKSEWFYQFKNDVWEKYTKKSELEKEMIESIIRYIKIKKFYSN